MVKMSGCDGYNNLFQLHDERIPQRILMWKNGFHAASNSHTSCYVSGITYCVYYSNLRRSTAGWPISVLVHPISDGRS